MQRRRFLKTALAGTVAPSLPSASREIPKRLYRDGVRLSIIGFGGIVVVGMDQKQADRTVAEAYERGVNYFDVAPSYWEGEAERKLGIALQPYRKNAFLACKTMRRDAAGAAAELEESLRRLRTDWFDLYQFHAVSSMKDVEQILSPGGAAELFVRARKEGKVRYLGFSAHNVEAALALLDRFPCDSVLFPVNFVCYAQGNFGPQVLARARQKGVARLALKALAHTNWPKGTRQEHTAHPKCWYQPVDDRDLAHRALRFTLSEDVTAAIPPGDERLFAMALELAAGFSPLSEQERKELLAATRGLEPIFRA